MFVVYKVYCGSDAGIGVQFEKMESFETLEQAAEQLEKLRDNPEKNVSYTVMIEN